MFYELTLKSHVRVSPHLFALNKEEAILKQLIDQFEDYVSKEIGIAIGVSAVENIGEGVIVPGDGSAYYDTTFKLYVFKPEMQEVIEGELTDITDFGTFINLGPIDGMIHISQTMDDYVTYSKTKVLTGKETKQVLKVGDLCRARIVAVSYKNPKNPKINLTMRQPLLGNVKYVEEQIKTMKENSKKKEKKDG